jgi:hypothetical protein
MIPWFGDCSNVIHVSKLGSDSNSGIASGYPLSLPDDSKLTIEAAVTACPDGGTVVFWPGDYAETVTVSGKSINVIGTHRTKCRIVPATGTGISFDSGGSLQNCYVYSANNYAVQATGNNTITVCNCYIVSDGSDGIYTLGQHEARIISCYVFCKYDVIWIGKNTLIDGCILIGDACAPEIGSEARVLVGGGGANLCNLILRNTHILMQPCYNKSGKTPTLYQVSCNIYGINGAHSAVLENCIIYVSGYKESSNHADSYFNGDAYGIANVDYLSMSNCKIHTRTDQNKLKTAYSMVPRYATVLENVIFKSEGQLASYDLYASTARTAVLNGCSYDPTKVHSNVTVQSVLNPDGPVVQAAKVIVNKAVQNKLTGAIDYYDDDGQTVILTQTPTEAESTITRMPS